MKNLKILHARGDYHAIRDCGIDDKGLPENLIELYASDNSKITNVSYMNNLKKLHASGSNCGINDKGLPENLIELDASYNPKITNVSYMKNLKILCALWNCGIDNKGLPENLIKLNASYNPKITNVYEYFKKNKC